MRISDLSSDVCSSDLAPMGIGIWYEMQISDPVSFLFKNTDPRGSLRANVRNATVRCLSNMPLGEMLETRHKMSKTVKIGRESCRERVCKVRVDLGGRRIIKKKKKKEADRRQNK